MNSLSDIRVLVVDDDREMRSSLVDLITAADGTAKALARANEVALWLPQFVPDVILSDLRMPGMTGLELLESLTPSAAPPVVLLSAHGDIPVAVEAMNAGAYSFVEKPCEPRRLLTILKHAADQHQMRRSNTQLRARLRELSGLDRLLVGQTAGITALRDDIAHLAATRVSVLITGETGTGKELVARALHDLSARAGQPFVPVNAALLTLDTVTHVARSARGGTLFLDEIAACPLEVQAMLLRLVELGELSVPGQGLPEQIDLRIVAATNADLAQACASGSFREDLHFRLATAPLHLPPLRDRTDDIVLLATHFLHQSAKLYDIAAPVFTEDDLAALLGHAWPGNVRELRTACERRLLAQMRGTGTMAEAIEPGEMHAQGPQTLREAVASFERQLIARAIAAQDGRMDAAAEALGIGRRTLNEKIVKLGLDKEALM